MKYLSKGVVSVPLTVPRHPQVSGSGFGSQHGQTLVNWVTSTPGLKVVTVSTPQNAYEAAALGDP